MRLVKVCMATLFVLFIPGVLAPAPGGGAIIGSVTYTGTPAKAEPINTSKEPDCVKLHAKSLMTEKVVTGPGNTLQNVCRLYFRGCVGQLCRAYDSRELRPARLPLHHSRARVSRWARRKDFQ
jgi:hypothetical protein